MDISHIKGGDRVRWNNPASFTDREMVWEVQSVSSSGAYTRITDRDRAYPNSQSFCVPTRCLILDSEWAPAKRTPAAAHSVYGFTRDEIPSGDTEYMYSWARDQGATAIQLAGLRKVILAPAGNKGMLSMRIKNYLLNTLVKEHNNECR